MSYLDYCNDRNLDPQVGANLNKYLALRKLGLI